MKSLSKVLLAFIILFTVTCKKKDATTQPVTVTNVTINTSLPSISTAAISSINNLTATCGGTVTSEGTSAITAVGICWDTLPGPTTLRDHTNEGAGTGSFKSILSNLKASSTYYVRAYASNATGTAYGNEVTFKTATAWTMLQFYNNLYAMTFNGGYIFAGTNQGVFRSSDEGMQWASVNNGLSDLNITCLETSGNFIFAGTQSGGVFRSSDGGNNWSVINNGLSGTNITALAVYGGTLFVSSYYGVSVSKNNGTNWSSVNSGLSSTSVNSITFDGIRVYLGTYNGVYVSSNFGSNWSLVNNGISTQNVTEVAISGNNVLASTNGGLFLSGNNGGNWTLVNSVSSVQPILCFATKNNDVYASGYGTVYVSYDNGVTFSELRAGLPGSPFVAITTSQKNVFTGGYSLFRLPL